MNVKNKSKEQKGFFRPMLFSTPMVQAILERRKTQTRRIMKHQPPLGNYKFGINVTGTRCKENGLFHWIGIDEEIEYKVTDSNQPYFKCPFNIGDIIWVRETFYELTADVLKGKYFYKADLEKMGWTFKWKPSLFMPKKACRLFLEITDIRIERLNEISESDAIEEGIKSVGKDIEFCGTFYLGSYFENYSKEGYSFLKPVESFRTLWEKINGIGSWQTNPFVWVYDFKVVECPEGFIKII